MGRENASLRRLSAASMGLAVGTLALGCLQPAGAQPPGFGGFGGAPPGPARESAPVDLTGTWVSLVTEDWVERMSPDSPASGTPGGGFGFGGFGRGGRGGGDAGDAARPTSSDPCAAYGAGGIMRVPGRIRISWRDDDTMVLEYDAGSQRRVINFAGDSPAAASGNNSLQGYSKASWESGTGGGRGRRGPQAGFGAPPDGRAGATEKRWGSLDVVTTQLTPGYLLSSRSWYGAGATVTELIRFHSDFGQQYFTVTTLVEENGATTSTTSSTFKKEQNDSKFKPAACEITPR